MENGSVKDSGIPNSSQVDDINDMDKKVDSDMESK
jgi:hypothetical protein